MPTHTSKAKPNRKTLGAAALAAAVGASSIFNFAFHGLASRSLTLDDYGALAAVLALMTAAAVPIGAAQTALTRSAAHIISTGNRPSGRRLLIQSLPLAIAIVGLATLCAPVLAAGLHLTNTTPLLVTGLWLGIVSIEAIPRALLIADDGNQSVAYALLAGAGLRLVSVTTLAHLIGLTGAVTASIVGELASLAIVTAASSRRGLFASQHEQVRITWPDAGRALSAQVSLWLLAATAVLIGRRTLAPGDGGTYAAMATLAGACVFLPQAVATITFPRFVADGSLRLLFRATGVAAVVGVVCAAVLSADPVTLFRLMFGPDYRPDRLVFAALCAHFIGLGCLTVLAQYLVARRHTGVGSMWIALFAATILGFRYGDTQRALTISLAVPSAMATLFVAVRAVIARRGFEQSHEAFASPAPESDQLSEPASIDVSIVVPTYNGGAALRPCITSICDTFDGYGQTYEVLVMVDGSQDGSDESVVDMHPNVFVHRTDDNNGKGAALRGGFQRARGSNIGFIDGDGDIAPSVLVNLVRALDHSDAWVAVASKNLPGANVTVTPLRLLMSGAYRMLVHWLFDLEITDTQCGCKMFRRAFLAATLEHTKERGFALDLELLSVGSRLGMRTAVEVPVILQRNGVGSAASRSTVFRMLSDTFRIRRRLPQRRWDGVGGPALAPVGGELSSPLLP
jgi:O-antigen/teichoic acid export membrane protein